MPPQTASTALVDPVSNLSALNLPALGYHAMRLRWCRTALAAFLRRWAVYLVVAAAAFGAGANSPLDIIVAAATVTVLPIYRAAQNPLWLLPAVALQSALGAGLIWAMRSWLWAATWRDAERALPIDAKALLSSDLRVVIAGLLPLWLPYAIGAVSLHGRRGAWALGTLGLGIAAVGSVALGVALLRAMRRPLAVGAGRRTTGLVIAGKPLAQAALPMHPIGWWRVVCWWPLWRGPARRGGIVGWGGCALLCVPIAAAMRWPAAGSWGLAAFAALALLITTRLNRLLRDELAVLIDSLVPLPIAPASVQRAIPALALAPAIAATVVLTLFVCGLWPPAEVRYGVLIAYTIACGIGCAAEVLLVPTDDVSKSGRWLFSLVLMIALASEVRV